MRTRPTPPRILRATVGLCLPAEDRTGLLADLDDLYADRRARTSRLSAIAWYARQTAGFVIRVATTRLAESVGSAEAYVTDASVALRYFRRRPSYAVGVILTLGLGTGVLVTVYAAAEWLLLRPVPGVAHEDGLMTLRLGSTVAPPHVSWTVSHPDLLTLREQLPVRGALAGRTVIDVDLRPQGGVARRVTGELVTANYFEVLGHSVSSGRAFLPDDERLESRAAVAVISHALARSFGRDPATALGLDIHLNGTSVRVVGVAGPGFRGTDLPGRTEIWLPLGALAFADPSITVSGDSRGIGVWNRMILRTESGTVPEGIAAAANGVIAAVRRDFRSHSYPASHYTFLVTPGIGLDPAVRTSVRRTVSLVGAAALFLLALTIANLVNLGLMESNSRATPVAVRIALGASRARMFRALCVEVMLLALGGAAVGVALAGLWTRWFQATQLSEYGGSLEGMEVSSLAVLASVMVASVAATLALLNPATLRRSRSVEGLLRRGSSAAPAPQRLRMTLVGVQVALTLLLLVSSGLLTGSVNNLRRVDLGFSPERLLVFSVEPHLHGYDAARFESLAQELESSFLAEPDVRGAGFVSPPPLRSSYITAAVYGGEGQDTSAVTGAGYFVTPGFMAALGVKTVAGDRQWPAQRGTIVISRGAATTLFPGARPEDAVGRVLRTGRTRTAKVLRIAAVVEDVRLSDIVTDPPPTFFRPLSERPAAYAVSGLLATERSPAAAASIVPRTLATRAPDLPSFDVQTAREAVDLQFAELNTMALVANTLSGIGVLLSAVGLYGVMSNAVAARRREIGIRAALGAAPRRLLARVLLGGAAPVTAGIVVGVGAAVAAGRLLAQYLFGLDPIEPSAFVAGIVEVLVVMAAACALPAYRASQVSPASVLREE